MDESDVGKILCQHHWGGTELLEVNTEIPLKCSSKAGGDNCPGFRSSHEASGEVTLIQALQTSSVEERMKRRRSPHDCPGE